MIKIRLSRHGAKKRPFFHIVATDSRFPRDGRYIEKLGTYQPMLAKDDEKRIALNIERIKYWLGVGAQATERVSLFLANVGLIEKPVFTVKPQQSAPKAKAISRSAEKAQKLTDAKAAELKAKEEAEAAAKAENEAKAEAAAKPVEVIAEPAEVIAEPAVEVIAEPAVEVIAEPAVEVIAEPAVEVIAEPTETPVA